MEWNAPKVSIIIPVYNGSNFLHEAINSALAQTYQNLEVIVVNDGSNDAGETERIALSYGERIRYLHKQNGGVATALNLGIEQMTGEYFSWLSHDDMYTPDKIAKQIQKLQQHGTPAVVYSDYVYISPHGQTLTICRVSPRAETNLRGLLALSDEMGLHGCSLLIPRRFFEQYGVFDPSLLYTQDVDMWFRLASNVPFIHVPELLVRSRRHEDQDSQRKKEAFWKECDLVLSGLIRKLSHDEISDYFDHSIRRASTFYETYIRIRFFKVASLILRQICLMADTSDKRDGVLALLNSSVALIHWKEEGQQFFEQLQQRAAVPGGKPRILVYSHYWVRGGAQRVIVSLIQGLKDKYDWIVVNSDEPGQDGFVLPPEVRQLQISASPAESIAFRLVALCAILDVQLFVGCSNFLSPLLPVYAMLQGTSTKSIACDFGHYFLPYRIEGLQPVVEARLSAYAAAGAVTWLTNYSAQIYAQQYGNGAVLPTPNSFPKATLRAHKKNKVIVAVGRLNDPIKRLDRMLQVFSKVLAKHPDALLLLVGPYQKNLPLSDESGETIEDLLSRLAIPGENLEFLGEQSQVKPFYLKASALMLTSESEGIPMVLNEAGTFALPCVIQEITGLDDIIIEGENGFIVPQGDLDGMADKLNLLLSDPELRMRMGDRACELVERFSQQRISERWERLIELLLTTDKQADLERALAAQFMEPIANRSAFNRRVAREYEAVMNTMLKDRPWSLAAMEQLPDPASAQMSHEAEVGAAEREAIYTAAYLQVMQQFSNTLSWKITRPLRWSKIIYVSMRNSGLKVTARKVVRKIRSKIRR